MEDFTLDNAVTINLSQSNVKMTLNTLNQPFEPEMLKRQSKAQKTWTRA